MRFSDGDLQIDYGLKYADLFDDSGDERALELAVPDRNISIIGLEVINNLRCIINTRDTEVAFKLMKYSLINYPHLQSLEINDVHSNRLECILSGSIDAFRKGVKKYVSTEASKVVELKGFIPSQECFDLLSCFLPSIQSFTCGIERGGRFDNSEVPQDYVVDLTQFKSLQVFYFDIQLVSIVSCLVKFEFIDGEKSYYQYRYEKDTMLEPISLEDIRNKKRSTISMITFK
ncbi:hypothetical protein EDC94DRAFT_686001 [Helicostylum pulchrum]|nr:hypothetical protein EDC94DRAFT_686001 [Helicostylum pulchrum]